MSPSKLPFSLPLLISFVIFMLQLGIRADDQTYLMHYCLSAGTFCDNDAYSASLNQLFTTFSSQALSDDFYKCSVGDDPNIVNGLFLCRGDTSPECCQDCITQATADILQRSPNCKSAIIWYDNCMVKYSHDEFFGEIDYTRFYMVSYYNVSDPESFNQKKNELLSRLAGEASEEENMYAAEAEDIDSSTKLYGLTQCSRDLSETDCKSCLDTIIGELPGCCYCADGGRAVAASCNVRYEIYPFLNA